MAGPLTPQMQMVQTHHLQQASSQASPMAPPNAMAQPAPAQLAQNQPSQVAHQAPPQQMAEQKFDLIARVRSLVWSLKESLANLMKIAASNIQHNSQIDTGSKTCEDDEKIARFDKALEDFFSICNQIELNLKTVMECTIQARDSVHYVPFSVSTTKPDNPDGSVTDNSISYNHYLNTVKTQINFAKTVHDMLLEGAKRISQNEPMIFTNTNQAPANV